MAYFKYVGGKATSGEISSRDLNSPIKIYDGVVETLKHPSDVCDVQGEHEAAIPYLKLSANSSYTLYISFYPTILEHIVLPTMLGDNPYFEIVIQMSRGGITLLEIDSGVKLYPDDGGDVYDLTLGYPVIIRVTTSNIKTMVEVTHITFEDVRIFDDYCRFVMGTTAEGGEIVLLPPVYCKFGDFEVQFPGD